MIGVMDVANEVTEQVVARKKIEEVVAFRTRELVAANQALQHLIHELKRSNANLEEFAHAASHDLKELGRKIQVFTMQLKTQLSSSLKPGELHSFDRIEHATLRMRHLIEDLLQYSQVSQKPLEKAPVALPDTIARVIDDLELNIAEQQAVTHIENFQQICV